MPHYSKYFFVKNFTEVLLKILTSFDGYSTRSGPSSGFSHRETSLGNWQNNPVIVGDRYGNSVDSTA